MKIGCECGGVIYDNTDYIPNKAYLVADQDMEDYLEAICKIISNLGQSKDEKEHAMSEVWKLFSTFTKHIYQCDNCGRLYIDGDNNTLEIFCKMHHDKGKSDLSSVRGEMWKRTLIGDWNDKREGKIKGYIWCMGISQDEGCFESWYELEKKYYEIFENLKTKNILRSAILNNNYERIHSWSMNK